MQPSAVQRDYSHREVWRLAWPMIVSNISVPLLGVIDTAILGHLDSPVYLGAVAVGASILNFLLWGFGFLRMGTTGLVARALGGARPNLCQLLLAQAALLGIVLALALIATQSLIFPIAMTLMEPGPEVKSWALNYCSIRIYAAPATLVNYAVIGWFIGLQDTRSPLLLMLATNLLNIILDWLLIVVLDMKSDGAATATVIAEYASLLLALGLVQRKRRKLPGHLVWTHLRQLGSYLELIRVNRHLFVRTASLLFAFAFFTAQGAQQGETILAANAILLQLLMLTAYGLDGFAHAAEALTGKAIGAGRREDFFRACRSSSLWALLTAVAITSVFVIFNGPIIGLFSDIPEVINTVNHYYPWLCALPLLAAGSYQLDGIFIGAGKSQAMQNAMLLACFGVFLPLWWLTQGLGNHGLWFAFCSFNCSRTLFMGWMFRQLSKEESWC